MKPNKAVEALSALAQESRLAIFMLLLEIGDDGMSAGDIAQRLEIPDTTLSFHLSQLKSANLVGSRKEGRFVIYSANKKKVKKLAKYITGKNAEKEL